MCADHCVACHNATCLVQWVSVHTCFSASSTAPDWLIDAIVQTLVIYAVSRGATGCFKLLIDFGCDVTYRVVRLR